MLCYVRIVYQEAMLMRMDRLQTLLEEGEERGNNLLKRGIGM